jgi:hypothetical protein
VIWGRVLEQNPQSKKQNRKCAHVVRSRDNCCLAKTRNITYSECLSVPIVIQHSKRVHHVILSSVVYVAVLNFSHCLINKKIFRKKIIEMCVLIFCTRLSEIFLFLRKFQRDIFINVRTSSYKVPVILRIFESNLNFLDIEVLELQLS